MLLSSHAMQNKYLAPRMWESAHVLEKMIICDFRRHYVLEINLKKKQNTFYISGKYYKTIKVIQNNKYLFYI